MAWYKNPEFAKKKNQIVLRSSSEELSTAGCLNSSSLGPATMSSGYCYTSCPPMMVTIQPPPYTLNIPGPTLYCADQSVCIEQCNPCAAIPPGGFVGHGGCGFLPANAASDFSFSGPKSVESDYYF